MGCTVSKRREVMACEPSIKEMDGTQMYDKQREEIPRVQKDKLDKIERRLGL